MKNNNIIIKSILNAAEVNKINPESLNIEVTELPSNSANLFIENTENGRSITITNIDLRSGRVVKSALLKENVGRFYLQVKNTESKHLDDVLRMEFSGLLSPRVVAHYDNPYLENIY